MKIILIFTIIIIVCPLFSGEKESYEELILSLKKYSRFLGNDEKAMYDRINSPENEKYIKEYIEKSKSYLNEFRKKPDFKKLKTIKLPEDTVSTFWIRFSKNEREILCNRLAKTNIYLLKNGLLEKLWEGNTPAFEGVGCIDLEGDGRNEIMAFSKNIIYSFRKSKKGVIFYQKFQNFFGIINIFQNNDNLFGIIRRVSDDISKKSGTFLVALEWAHPGFNIKRDIMELSGEMVYQKDNKLYIISNLEQNHGLVNVYYFDNNESLKLSDRFMVDTKKNIAGIYSLNNEYIVFLDNGFSKAYRDKDSLKISDHGMEIEGIKNGWIIDGSIITLLFSNNLAYYRETKKSLPLFASGE